MDGCLFCKREINNKGSLASHQKVCKLNPARVKFKRSPNAGKRKGTPAWNKGKTNVEIFGEERAKEVNERISAGVKRNCEETGSTWSKMTDDQKSKFRLSHTQCINKRYESGWMPKAGRCKKIKFNSKIAGEVSLDGTWELEVAKYLDENDIEWRRNTKRFEYKNEEDCKSFYTPDFYILEHDIFIEVKGYETEKDRCKWRDFPNKINIFKSKELKKIKLNLDFEQILKESKLVGN